MRVAAMTACLALSALVLNGCGGSGTYKEVRGTVGVKLEGNVIACSDYERLPAGYSDVHSMQIVVRDVDEKFLIEMYPNPFNSSKDGCMLDTWYNFFSGEDLPKRDKYIIDAGQRGQFFVDAEDFTIDDDGDVEIFRLTLGG